MTVATRPDTVSGLRAWYTSDDAFVTTSDGVSVTGWTDRSGNGFNLIAHGSPQLVDPGDGRKAIAFDGVDDIFAPITSVLAVASAHTIIVNAFVERIPGSICPVSVGGPSVGHLALMLDPFFRDKAMVSGFSDTGHQIDPLVSRQYISAGDWHQYLLREGNPYRLRVGVDSTDAQATFGISPAANALSIGGLYWGGAFRGSFKGKLRDVMVFNRTITDNEWLGLLAWMVGSNSANAPPTISNIAPAPGTAISRADPIFFDVTDDLNMIRRAVLCAKFSDGTYEVIHDGESFAQGYASLSTRTAIANGWHYRVRRTAGWPSGPTLVPFITDTSGNEFETE